MPTGHKSALCGARPGAKYALLCPVGRSVRGASSPDRALWMTGCEIAPPGPRSGDGDQGGVQHPATVPAVARDQGRAGSRDAGRSRISPHSVRRSRRRRRAGHSAVACRGGVALLLRQRLRQPQDGSQGLGRAGDIAARRGRDSAGGGSSTPARGRHLPCAGRNRGHDHRWPPGLDAARPLRRACLGAATGRARGRRRLDGPPPGCASEAADRGGSPGRRPGRCLGAARCGVRPREGRLSDGDAASDVAGARRDPRATGEPRDQDRRGRGAASLRPQLAGRAGDRRVRRTPPHRASRAVGVGPDAARGDRRQ